MQTETTATQIPDSSNSDVDTDIEEKQSPKKNEVDMSVQRALDTLEVA